MNESIIRPVVESHVRLNHDSCSGKPPFGRYMDCRETIDYRWPHGSQTHHSRQVCQKPIEEGYIEKLSGPDTHGDIYSIHNFQSCILLGFEPSSVPRAGF